ncbi:MAG: integrase [Hyphomicrobiales bacterium]|nr:integrase [Hyphomicrobiales bacterium]
MYIEEIASDDPRYKSEGEAKQWRKVKLRAVNNFIKVVSDEPLFEVNREDALKFYNFWRKHIEPGEVGESAGNRDIGNMRVLFASYCKHMGLDQVQNPFAELSFSQRFKRSRPPFTVSWLKEKITASANLAKLNDQARGILLCMIDTGARPSEISNLLPENIHLNADIPHISIMPNIGGSGAREIKPQSSTRKIPLVGLALEATRNNPHGFPKYRDRDNAMSAVLLKWLRVNELQETPDHTVYSIRHSFEDRMKEAGLDDELRRILMGHSINRPKYGSGGELKWRRDELLNIVW